MDTPSKQRKSILAKIFGQLSVHVEDVGASIEMKKKIIAGMESYPSKLETYVQNYILTERDSIVEAAEDDLREFIRPIENQQREITSSRISRQKEMKELERQQQEEFENFQRANSKDRKAEFQLEEILKMVQNKLHYMKNVEGYP